MIKQSSKESYKKVIDKLIQCGAEGIILGRTESTLLISQDDCVVLVFDTTKIHAEQAVEYALKSKS